MCISQVYKIEIRTKEMYKYIITMVKKQMRLNDVLVAEANKQLHYRKGLIINNKCYQNQ